MKCLGIAPVSLLSGRVVIAFTTASLVAFLAGSGRASGSVPSRGYATTVPGGGTVGALTFDPARPRGPWTAEGDQPGANFGESVGTAGDVNRDGHDDVIVGAPLYDNGQETEGRAFVYHGSAGGPNQMPDWTAESNQAGAFFGYSVASAGDVNGDGHADVIVGAFIYDNGQTDEGRAFVYHGSAAGLSVTPNWMAESDQPGALFGNSVGTAGDVNRDGFDDVIVGAPFYENGQDVEGRAFVYHGSVAGLSDTAAWTAESNQANAWFGASVGTAGDVNRDGYDDVIVGAPFYKNGQDLEGRAYLYHGSPAGLSDTADWTGEVNHANAVFGESVGTAGDVNGDGYADVLVGARGYSNGQEHEGRAFAYHGSADGLGTTADWTAEPDRKFAWFGAASGTAGDVNGDGYDDVIVGAYGYGEGQGAVGGAFLYHGSAGGLSPIPNWRAQGGEVLSYFGNSVGTAGDVNGDGYAEHIVGAPESDHGQNGEGRAFVWRGRA
jgi:hypothetical protein